MNGLIIGFDKLKGTIFSMLINDYAIELSVIIMLDLGEIHMPQGICFSPNFTSYLSYNIRESGPCLLSFFSAWPLCTMAPCQFRKLLKSIGVYTVPCVPKESCAQDSRESFFHFACISELRIAYSDLGFHERTHISRKQYLRFISAPSQDIREMYLFSDHKTFHRTNV